MTGKIIYIQFDFTKIDVYFSQLVFGRLFGCDTAGSLKNKKNI